MLSEHYEIPNKLNPAGSGHRISCDVRLSSPLPADFLWRDFMPGFCCRCNQEYQDSYGEHQEECERNESIRMENKTRRELEDHQDRFGLSSEEMNQFIQENDIEL